MFCDEAIIHVKAGNGGNGMVSFRREKYVSKGGPDGGDGGKGGDIILRSNPQINTLSDYRSARVWKAEDGKAGGPKKLHGRSGNDLILDVPVGTIVLDDEEKVIIDFVEPNMEFTIAYGGRGGYGNAHFTSSIRQAPRFAEQGESMTEMTYDLELKLVADVGIIGFPSVGKSTLISVISNSKPKIAAYEFTTLVPNLGTVKVDNIDFVVADIPGLIEGASQGKGLGDTFLRHIERCGFLIHVLDGTDPDCFDKYEIINHELAQYSETLASKEQIVCINKSDSFDLEYQALLRKSWRDRFSEIDIYFISAIARQGIDELLYVVKDKVILSRHKEKRDILHDTYDQDENKRVVFRPHLEKTSEWVYSFKDGKHIIHGKRIEQIANMTDASNPEALTRLYDVLHKKGILKKLSTEGWDEMQPLWIGEHLIEF